MHTRTPHTLIHDQTTTPTEGRPVDHITATIRPNGGGQLERNYVVKIKLPTRPTAKPWCSFFVRSLGGWLRGKWESVVTSGQCAGMRWPPGRKGSNRQDKTIEHGKGRGQFARVPHPGSTSIRRPPLGQMGNS